ncbi:nucleotide sugar dehydrogenase [Candidatus Pelagibacter bacterium]|nr:nucleotide sugar dehydrogenase [Candidatus Pelagibacter bacterium]
MINKSEISIIGGSGHVGFPLGLVFSSKGFKVKLIDKNHENNKLINSGVSPYLEAGSKSLLPKMLKLKRISATENLESIQTSKFIIICIGTPIDGKLKPKTFEFLKFFSKIKRYIKRDQIIIIRSSVYPGISEKVFEIIKDTNKNLSYCPERIVQGQSISELPKISQLISGKNKLSINESAKLFKKICKKIIKVSIIEAELIKLFSNAYRYVHFSISNQFFMICKNNNLNFFKIRDIMKDNYNRNAHLPMSGFTAGPCLLKDTMQLSSFFDNKFSLGHTAMKINQYMPEFIIRDLSKKINLKKKTIGVLGLAFKGESDDIRDSLSIKLLKYLKRKKIKTLYSDEFYKMEGSLKKKHLIKKSDIIIICAPHKAYKNIKVSKRKVLIDIWGLTGNKN